MQFHCYSFTWWHIARYLYDGQNIIVLLSSFPHFSKKELKKYCHHRGNFHCFVFHFLEAIPGNIRKAEHFVGFMRRFIEYLKVKWLSNPCLRKSCIYFFSMYFSLFIYIFFLDKITTAARCVRNTFIISSTCLSASLHRKKTFTVYD